MTCADGVHSVTAQLQKRKSTFEGPLPRLLLVIASIILSLLAVEGAVRVYARVTKQERGMTSDPELGWRPLPNVEKIGDIWGVSRPASTNSHGWRDRERTYAKRRGTLRAVAIGDSFTFGVGVDDGERFTDVLSAKMQQLEVVNLGVAGYGPDQELRALELYGVEYQPDLVFLTIFLGNDLADIRYERLYSWPKPHYSLEGGRLKLWKPRLTWGIHARTASYLAEFLYQYLTNADAQGIPAPELTTAHLVPLFDVIVRQIAKVTAEHGARLVAVMAYPADQLSDEPSELSQHVTQTLEQVNVVRLDTKTIFAGWPDASRLLYSTDGHWNAKGHAVVADGIRDLLTRKE